MAAYVERSSPGGIMPNRDKAPLFITKLVSAAECSGAIKIEFNAGSEEVFTRYLSKPYARELAFALLQILAAEQPEPSPPFDDIKLEDQGETIRFQLLKDGKMVLTGNVTKNVAKHAHKWLTRLFDGPNVIRPDALKKRSG